MVVGGVGGEVFDGAGEVGEFAPDGCLVIIDRVYEDFRALGELEGRSRTIAPSFTLPR